MTAWWQLGGRYWLLHPWRTLLTLLTMTLGVAIVLATSLITSEILGSHRRALEHLSGKAQLSVSGTAGGVMPETLADELSEVPGVAAVESVVTARVVEPGRGPVTVIGLDFLNDGALRDLSVAGDQPILKNPLAFLNSPEAVLVPESFARARALVVGGRFAVVTSRGRRELEIRGLLQDKGMVTAFGGDVIVMQLDAAQALLGLVDQLTRIDLGVKAPESKGGTTPEALRRVLTAKLGETYPVDFPASRGGDLEAMMAGFNQTLAMIAQLMVLLGGLFTYNAVLLGIHSRKKSLAILRALGAYPREIGFLVVSEALVLGFIATALGIGVGYFLARVGVAGTADVVGTLFVEVHPDALHWSFAALAQALAVGIVVPLSAALGPAWWLTRCSPIVDLKQAETTVESPVTGTLIFVAILLAAGLALSPLAAQPVLATAALSVVLLASLLLVSRVVKLAAHVLRRLLGGDRRVALMLVALDHVERDRRRFAVNLAALTASVAIVLAFSIYIQSFRQSYESWLTAVVPADLVATAGAKLALTRHVRLDWQVADELRTVPGVDEVLPLQRKDLLYDGRLIKVLAVPAVAYLRRAKPLTIAGQLEGGALNRGEAIVVSESFARHHQTWPGAKVHLAGSGGGRDFLVQAVMVDFTSDQGLIFMDSQVFADLFSDHLVDSFYLWAKPGADLAKTRALLQQSFGERYDLVLLSGQEFRAEGQRLIDGFFALLNMLRGLALIVAAVGISSVLFTNILDRRAELAMLRAVGAGEEQILRIALAEAAVAGGIALVYGSLLGIVLGVAFLRSLAVSTTGWALPWLFPFVAFAVIAVAVLLVSLLSAWPAARFAARLPVARSLAD